MAPNAGAPGTPATLALRAAGVPFTGHLYEHDPRVTNFGEEAAEKLGVPSGRVFKTLIVAVTGSLVVGVVPVTDLLDLKALAAAVGGGRASLADPKLAERRTGYVVGGISPIGQKNSLVTILDESAAMFETVFVSGGRRGFEIEIAPADLCAVTGARYAAISAPR